MTLLTKYAEGLRGKSVLVDGARYDVSDTSPASVTVDDEAKVQKLLATGWQVHGGPVDDGGLPVKRRRGRPRKEPIEEEAPAELAPPPSPVEPDDVEKALSEAPDETSPVSPPLGEDLLEELAPPAEKSPEEKFVSAEMGAASLREMAKDLGVPILAKDTAKQIAEKINKAVNGE